MTDEGEKRPIFAALRLNMSNCIAENEKKLVEIRFQRAFSYIFSIQTCARSTQPAQVGLVKKTKEKNFEKGLNFLEIQPIK